MSPMTDQIQSELEAEVGALTDLATNLGDGLTKLKAANISRPLSTFSKETGTPFPDRQDDVPPFCDQFIEWQLGRLKKAADKEKWSSDEALEDVRKVVARKVWTVKIENDTVYNDSARALATLLHIAKDFRSKSHETVNHIAKHNSDVKALASEIHEGVDQLFNEHLKPAVAQITSSTVKALPKEPTFMEDFING